MRGLQGDPDARGAALGQALVVLHARGQAGAADGQHDVGAVAKALHGPDDGGNRIAGGGPRLHAQLVRADAKGGCAARHLRPARRGERQAKVGRDERAALHAPVHEVHHRRPHEARHEAVGRSPVALRRRAELLHHAELHHHHAVGKRHRLFLVVGDVDHAGLRAPVQLADLRAHLDAQPRVQVGEGFVEEEHLRVAHQRTPERHALALSAGERARQALEQALDAERARGVEHLAVDRFQFRPALGAMEEEARQPAARAAPQQAEGHVPAHRHVRVERIVLEHHGHVAVLGRQVVDHAPADGDGAAGDGLEPGHHAEQGALSAAGGADQHDELAVLEGERCLAYCLHVAGVGLGHFREFDGCHVCSVGRQPLTAPLPSPSMNCFCAARKSSTQGIMVVMLAAISRLTLLMPPNWLRKLLSATLRVAWSSLCR